jgi:prepilin-type N-terminal cleavage/methylation domain-containing protein
LKIENYKLKIASGFTLMELLVGIGILSILSTIAIWHWSGYRGREALSKDRMGVIAMFEEARSLSLASKSNSAFGVHMSSTTVSIFKGNIYDSGSSENINYSLNSSVEFYSINLTSGESDIIFKRLLGSAENSGTVKLFLLDEVNSSTTITILESGVVQ